MTSAIGKWDSSNLNRVLVKTFEWLACCQIGEYTAFCEAIQPFFLALSLSICFLFHLTIATYLFLSFSICFTFSLALAACIAFCTVNKVITTTTTKCETKFRSFYVKNSNHILSKRRQVKFKFPSRKLANDIVNFVLTSMLIFKVILGDWEACWANL